MARRGGGRGGGASGIITGLIIGLVLIFVGLNLVSTLGGSFGNLTYAGTGFASTLFDIAKWLVPGLAVLGLVIYGLKALLGGRR